MNGEHKIVKEWWDAYVTFNGRQQMDEMITFSEYLSACIAESLQTVAREMKGEPQ